MTTNDKQADELAHGRFRADFNKLFSAAPTLRKAEPDRAARRRNDMRAFREACARMDARTALYVKGMQEREALHKRAAGLIGQVADLQSAVAKLKSVASNWCEVRGGMRNQLDRTSELAKFVDSAIDLFKDAPALLAMARLGGGADACEKLMAPNTTLHSTSDRAYLAKLY
jgi:hypothetical protein